MDGSFKCGARRTRRNILSAGVGLLSGFQVIPATALGRGRGSPSNKITLALIGCGGRGVFESKIYTESDDCQIVAVCDPREDRRIDAQNIFQKIYGERRQSGAHRGIDIYNDFRDVLRRKDIDAVHIATPDHWHVPITIAAARAGKDMHTEKPLGVSIEQDLAARKTVRGNKRIFQYGAERRSTAEARHAVELVLNGRIGKVEAIYVVAPPSSSGGAATPVLPVPPGFDYDLWLGPAPKAPFCHDRCLVDGTQNGIYHIYDYSLGFIGNWGAHPLDQVQWWADNSGLGIPASYEGVGRIAEVGLFNCVIEWDVRCRFTNGLPLRYMDFNTYAKHPEIPGTRNVRHRNAAIFVGTDGWVSLSYARVEMHPASLLTSVIGPNEIHLQRSESHQLSWIDAVKTRKDPVGLIESAVRSDTISHLSNISIRTGRRIHWDSVKETIVGDDGARELMSRPMRKPWKLT